MVHELEPSVYSVGVIDSDIHLFHGYEVPFGTTYNAYLIVDGDDAVLIDTVKVPFAQQLLANIQKVLGDKPLTHIICNHVEPDHSGALPAVVAAYPHAVVHGTKACARELAAYYPKITYPFVEASPADPLETEHFSFEFIPMPMVHWPDSMSTYVPEIETLFSNDALGQHIGTGAAFDSDISTEQLDERAGDYYANIVLPFGMQVEKLLASVGSLSIKRICPSHGVILTDSIPRMVEHYTRWSRNETDKHKAVIVYDTMWHTTEKMAHQLQGEWEDEGLNVELISLSEKHYSYAMAQLLEAQFLAVGSPTLNNQMLPSVAAFLTYAKGLKPKGRTALAFGSYGWSGESVKYIQDELESMGCTLLDSRKVQWNITEETQG